MNRIPAHESSRRTPGWFSRGILVVLALFLVSCATHPPGASELPATEIPSQWTSPGYSTSAQAQDRWWETFQDAALNDAVEEALARNHDLKSAVARLDAAAAQARIAGADLYPSAGLAFDARRQKQNFVGFPIPGAEDRILTSRSTVFGLGLNSSWEMDLWGRVRSGRRAALAEVQASQADLAGATNSLAAQTIRLWMAAAEARRQLDLARATVSNYQATAEQVRFRYERGVRSPLDLRLALTAQSAAEALVSERENQLQAVRRQFEILLGRYPAGVVEIGEDMPAPPPSIPAGLPSELLQRRPDLVSAERRLAAAGARRKQARAARFPRLSLTASGGTSSDELADLLSSQFSVWTLAGNLAQPIFEGGRLRAGEELASAREREALEEYGGAVLRAFAEVETALSSEQWLARREHDLIEAARQAQAALDLAEDRYAGGLENFAMVLEAQRRVLDNASLLISVRRARIETRLDLHLALGGGFGPAQEMRSSENDPTPEARNSPSGAWPGGNPVSQSL
jgi:outer membrane protein, multidrug efflux system